MAALERQTRYHILNEKKNPLSLPASPSFLCVLPFSNATLSCKPSFSSSLHSSEPSHLPFFLSFFPPCCCLISSLSLPASLRYSLSRSVTSLSHVVVRSEMKRGVAESFAHQVSSSVDIEHARRGEGAQWPSRGHMPDEFRLLCSVKLGFVCGGIRMWIFLQVGCVCV